MRIRKLAMAVLVAGVPTASAFSQGASAAADQSVPRVSPNTVPRAGPTTAPRVGPTTTDSNKRPIPEEGTATSPPPPPTTGYGAITPPGLPLLR